MKSALLAFALLAAAPTPARSGTRGGHTRAVVKGVQAQLVSRGFPAGYPDGRWSEATTAALRDFQREAGIAPTGEADAATLDALFTRQPEKETPETVERERGVDPVPSNPKFPKQIFGLGTAFGFLVASMLSAPALWRSRRTR